MTMTEVCLVIVLYSLFDNTIGLSIREAWKKPRHKMRKGVGAHIRFGIPLPKENKK